MKKIAVIVSIFSILAVLSGCNSVSTGNASQNSSEQSREIKSSISSGNASQNISEQSQEIKFSDNILFSINNGAAGFGTQAECTDAEIYVYTDRTIKVLMAASDYETIVEIASFNMSEEDFAKLSEVADNKKIYNLEVKDGEGDDGSRSYITLYDENDEKLISKGGYMPVGDSFCETYRAIKDIIEPYGINAAVSAHRKTLS